MHQPSPDKSDHKRGDIKTRPPDEPLTSAWRKALCARQPHASPGDVDSLGFLLELVRDEEVAATAHLEAAPVLLAAAVHDTSAKATPLDPQRLTQCHLTLAEQRLAATVLGHPLYTRKGRHYLRLTGALGDSLLTDMLDTAACFLGGVAGLHLTRGKTQVLSWEWVDGEDGLQHLAPRLSPNQQLLQIGKLWYLDAQNAALALLYSEYDEAWLLNMPPLAPEHTAPFAQALARSPLAKRLPEPKVYQIAKPLQTAPVPVIVLHARSGQAMAQRGTPLAYACLQFDYAGERLQSGSDEPTVRRIHRGTLIEIHRQRAEELAAMERLEQIGLHPAVDTEGLPWEVAHTLPEHAWLFSGAGRTGALEVNTATRWLALRERVQAAGFSLEYAASFPFEVLDAPVQWYVRAHDKGYHRDFALEVGIELDGAQINLLPAIARALHKGELALDEEAAGVNADATWYAPIDTRRRVPVRLSELTALLAPIRDGLQRPLDEYMQLPRAQAGRLDELATALPETGHMQAPAALREFTSRLRDAATRTRVETPATLHAILRPYQHEGLRWLNALASARIGGILADDMGLGKTLQVLAHLLALKEAGELHHPVLVVAPTSLIPNWESEAARFAPSLPVLTLSGPNRADHFTAIDDHALVLSSYALVPRDIDTLKKHRFSLVVLDEAQQVKNPRTRARRAILALQAPTRLCLTGTPLENHLGELWSQVDLAVPGLLGGEKSFQHQYRTPIEKERNEACQQRLNQRLAPFMLRRTKAQVATELPPKTEVTRRVIMAPRQRRLYEDLRADLTETLHQTIHARGIERSGIIVLDALLKLRQICCDPRLLKQDAARGVSESAKFELLMDILPALIAEGRRVLVFSQFTEMLKLIATELTHRHIDFVTLTGDTRDRAEPVNRFQNGEVPLFLLSLKAGGVGLNLTQADVVIHYDPWWNPAAEAQASDRAHRIGQDKPVLVYRLITTDTVEERIETMKLRKAELAQAVLAGGGTRERLRFDQEDLDALLVPGPDPGC